MEPEKVQIILEALNQAQGALRQSQRGLDRLTQANRRQTSVVQRLNRALNQNNQLVNRAKIAFAAAGAAITAMGIATLRTVDRFGKLAESTGFTTEKLSAMAFAAERGGVGFEIFQRAMRNFGVRLVQATQGLGEAQQAVELLGLSLTDANGQLRPQGQLLDEVTDKLAAMEDGAQKAFIAQRIFGEEAGPKLIPVLNQGSEGLERFAQRAEEMGVIIDTKTANSVEDFNDSLTDLKDVTRGVVLDIVQDVLPALRAVTRLAIENREVVVAAFKAIAAAVAAATTAFIAYKSAKISAAVVGAVVGAGEIRNVRDFAAGLRLIGAARFAAAAGSLAGLVKIIELGVEAWRLWNSRKEEALSVQNLEESTDAWRQTVEDNIDEFERLGRVTEQQAREMRRRLDEAFQPSTEEVRTGPSDFNMIGGRSVVRPAQTRTRQVRDIDQQRDLLRDITDNLSEAAGLDSDRADAIDDQNAGLQRQASLQESQRVSQAFQSLQGARLQSSLDRGEISIEQFTRRRIELAEQAFSRERQLVEAKIDAEEASAAELQALEFEHQQKILEIQDNARRLREQRRQEEQRRIEQTIQEQVTLQRRAEQQKREAFEETNRLLESGAITQTEAQRRNEQAARAFRQELDRIIQRLDGIAQRNPDMRDAIDSARRQIQDSDPFDTGPATTGGAGVRTGVGRFTEGLTGLNNTAELTARTLQGTLGEALNGVSRGITGLITGTQTWGQVFQQVGISIISTLIQIGVEMVAQSILASTLRATQTAESTAQASQTAAAWAPAAALSSIGSYGTAAVIGLGLVLAALAAMAALSFEEGGIVPGAPSTKDNRLASVASGEVIIPTDVVRRWGAGHFAQYFDGNMPGFAGGPMPTSGFQAGGLVPDAPANTTVNPAGVNVAVLNNREEAREFMRSTEGRKIIFDEMTRRSIDLGINS